MRRGVLVHAIRAFPLAFIPRFKMRSAAAFGASAGLPRVSAPAWVFRIHYEILNASNATHYVLRAEAG